MALIRIKNGLDVPLAGKPSGEVQTLPAPKRAALQLHHLENLSLKLLTEEGSSVKIGQPLLLDKAVPERMFVSPAAGVVREVRRGPKRRLMDLVIENASADYFDYGRIDVASISREALVAKLLMGGLFAHIRRRPFNRLAHPQEMPRSIFVKALESAPFQPSAEMQVLGHEIAFQAGLAALKKLTPGSVHLVYHAGSSFAAFSQIPGVEGHTAEGPHPIANPSVHIHQIDPIVKVEDVVWTVNAHDVVCIGKLLTEGRYHNQRIVSLAGTGILAERRGFFRAQTGQSINDLTVNRIDTGVLRLISGSVLTGEWVEKDGFLGFSDFSVCAIPENTSREFMHFFRLGFDKYSATRAYASGHIKSQREYQMTTSQNGEERAFVDGAIYDKVMPMRIPTMPLVKAVLAEDYELAEALGLLEVDSEDFALPTFIDPCKIEMVSIIKKGLQAYASETLG